MIWVALLALIFLLALLIRRSRHSRRPPLAMSRHSCGARNARDANYCRRCGEPLTIDLFDESGPQKR
jgi:hypothetical protein